MLIALKKIFVQIPINFYGHGVNIENYKFGIL